MHLKITINKWNSVILLKLLLHKENNKIIVIKTINKLVNFLEDIFKIKKYIVKL